MNQLIIHKITMSGIASLNWPARNCRTRALLSTTVALLVLYFAISQPQKAFAVDPPPDGGYRNGNTANGFQALFGNRASNNTATGVDALFKNTSGTSNTATGFEALQNNTASNNTATGASALFSNTIGTQNTANGDHALSSNTG